MHAKAGAQADSQEANPAALDPRVRAACTLTSAASTSRIYLKAEQPLAAQVKAAKHLRGAGFVTSSPACFPEVAAVPPKKVPSPDPISNIKSTCRSGRRSEAA